MIDPSLLCSLLSRKLSNSFSFPIACVSLNYTINYLDKRISLIERMTASNRRIDFTCYDSRGEYCALDLFDHVSQYLFSFQIQPTSIYTNV